ncbi:YeiH family protein [Halorhabdus rudnickae]|uniref:YeiH family protein n=1 Tax=Halorhabdus rudnickae TaxID=1775544 RepID=UPI0010830CE2|nr:putative sulfate exporter family transporter [Halorhabdus rudnickae]
MIRQSVRLLPGIALLVAGAALAHGLSATLLGINELLVAVGLGVLLGNVVGVPEWASAGLNTQKLWLETGIVLMGARIAIGQLFAVGVELLALVVGFLAFSLLFVEVVARNVFGIPERLGSLLAAGYSVCGVSAIVAVSSGVRAKSEQIAYAVGTILLFDAVTLAVYPAIGRFLDLPDIVFGTWAGISMVSTGPVVAAGFAYSPQAGQWATVTKLGRNVFIGVVAVCYAVYYARRYGTDSGADDWRYLWSQFPKFVVGFVIVAAVASVGLLTEADVARLEATYQWLFLLAFVGLGTNIELATMRKTGVQPLLVVLTALVTVSALSLLASLVVFA